MVTAVVRQSIEITGGDEIEKHAGHKSAHEHCYAVSQFSATLPSDIESRSSKRTENKGAVVDQ